MYLTEIMATTSRLFCRYHGLHGRQTGPGLVLVLVLAIISLGVEYVEPSSTQEPSNDAKVRLIEGSDIHEGVLEYFHPLEKVWLPVCGEGVQTEDANVVCRELGFHGADVIKNVTGFSINATSALLNVWCDTVDGVHIQHNSLDECLQSGVADIQSCNEKAAHIKCLTTRLTGGHDMSSGRLEVWSPGFGWGKVCSPDFGEKEQEVTCRELGYMYVNLENLGSANQFQDSALTYEWEDIRCTGSETKLADCDVDTTGSTSCPGDNDAYASCTNIESDPGKPPFMGVKLFDGPCATEGRLEVFDGHDYGTVCQEQITQLDARVVCRQLGFEYENAEVVKCCDTYPAARVGASDLFGVLNCTGDESMIAQCPHPPVGSRVGCTTLRHVNDVGIRCQACQIKKVNIAAVIGGVVAFTVVFIVIGVVLWYICYIPRRKYEAAADEQDDEPDIEPKDEATDHVPTANGFEENANEDMGTELNDDDLREKKLETEDSFV
ncbi:neurotrypsin-like [Lytechinus variegatus]|uniref:neurotrypsin-like n=1 Tax=Lytechinus variegatus TaxID=7654 RepID=UPI001BB19094|nr:neurotrypsin-like [Lytechinus variegatus]